MSLFESKPTHAFICSAGLPHFVCNDITPMAGRSGSDVYLLYFHPILFPLGKSTIVS